MANRKFKRNNAGVKALLKSDFMLRMTENYARAQANGAEIKSFIGFDRAKTIIGGKK